MGFSNKYMGPLRKQKKPRAVIYSGDIKKMRKLIHKYRLKLSMHACRTVDYAGRVGGVLGWRWWGIFYRENNVL